MVGDVAGVGGGGGVGALEGGCRWMNSEADMMLVYPRGVGSVCRTSSYRSMDCRFEVTTMGRNECEGQQGDSAGPYQRGEVHRKRRLSSWCQVLVGPSVDVAPDHRERPRRHLSIGDSSLRVRHVAAQLFPTIQRQHRRQRIGHYTSTFSDMLSGSGELSSAATTST
jgi:hypothetical protein